MENVEINALLKIIGLQYRLKYENDDDMKTLRYGKVMVMADQVCSSFKFVSGDRKSRLSHCYEIFMYMLARNMRPSNHEF